MTQKYRARGLQGRWIWWLSAFVWLVLVGRMSVAQTSAAAIQVSNARSGVPAKAMAFDVVSIRPSAPGSPWGGVQMLPDGYRAWGIGLWVTVKNAYIPSEVYSPERIQGMQPWMTSEKYDIVAKVAPADVAEWQRQNNLKQPKVMM